MSMTCPASSGFGSSQQRRRRRGVSFRFVRCVQPAVQDWPTCSADSVQCPGPAIIRTGAQSQEQGQADQLSSYRAKRDFERDAEPAGERRPRAGGARFVVQEHHATRLHWDLRLEHDGVLASWAIPNGIPPDPADNRLAVRTEDHPLEYLEFHGEIPKGQYGAGTMTIWDRGTYEVHKWERAARSRSPSTASGCTGATGCSRSGAAGRAANDWMIHRMDPPGGLRTASRCPSGSCRCWPAAGELPAASASGRSRSSGTACARSPTSQPGRLRLESRNLNEITAAYPEVRGLLATLGMHEAVLDGEIVAFDDDGRPSFERLQRRMHVTSPTRGAAAAGQHAGRLRDLRPAVPRRALADRAALRASGARALEELELGGPAWRVPAAPSGRTARGCSRRPRSRASRASSPSGWTRATSPAGAAARG